jgi:hypothetical protein
MMDIVLRIAIGMLVGGFVFFILKYYIDKTLEKT